MVIIVTYESAKIDGKEFYCKQTGKMEEVPGIGDFGVFWNDDEPDRAVCANFVSRLGSAVFLASDNCGYNNAIKFRNYEQYLAVKGIYDEN